MRSTARKPTGQARLAARTLRTDRWWLSPLLVACVLGVFIVYTTVRLFMRDLYWFPEGGYH